MAEVEIWREIDFTDGKYSVSNFGRVKRNEIFFIDSLGRKCSLDSKMVNTRIRKAGYEEVVFSMTDYRKYTCVHRLVATAFIENENEYPCVDHIDGNRANNVSSNLRWCTHKQNTNFELARENYKRCSDKKRIAVIQMDLLGNFLQEHESMSAAARYIGVNQANICTCSNGLRKSSGGFTWKKKEVIL